MFISCVPRRVISRFIACRFSCGFIQCSESHRGLSFLQSGGSVSGSGYSCWQQNASRQLSSFQQAAQAAALLVHNPIAMSTQQPPGLRYGSGAQETISSGAHRSDRSRDCASVRSPGGISSTPLSVGPQAMQDQTETYDSILNRWDSMESRMRANAQTMADMAFQACRLAEQV